MPSHKNRILLAGAGTGKTTLIIDAALSDPAKRILITTYTDENTEQIRSYFVERCGYVPQNVTVLPWFSFLLHEGVRPYQTHMTAGPRIRTIDFASIPNRYAPKAEVESFYLVGGDRIYRDRVSDFICECTRRSNGAVIRRLQRIYDCVFIDEFQDLAGYDLDIVESLLRSPISVMAVGDPRQATFSTNRNPKNKQFKRSNIHSWIQKMEKYGICAVAEVTECHRANQAICDFADALYPLLPKSVSRNERETGHDGVFLISELEVHDYYDRHRPVVLRWDKRAKTMGLPARNMGATKGRTFDRVLIFPTKPMREYLSTKDLSKAGDISKLYVAVTRARFSVTFVIP